MVEDDLGGNQFNSKKKGYKRRKVRESRGGQGYLGEQTVFVEEEEKKRVFKVSEAPLSSKSKQSAGEKRKERFNLFPKKASLGKKRISKVFSLEIL